VLRFGSGGAIGEVEMGKISLKLGDEVPPTKCDCCGKVARTVYGFVYESGQALAMYHAGWSKGHPEQGVALAIEFGKWGEGEAPEERHSIGVEVWPDKAKDIVRILDPDQSPWGDEKDMGRMLKRDEALAHPDKPSFLRVAKRVIYDDPRIRDYLTSIR
jgi:hypothetical protein